MQRNPATHRTLRNLTVLTLVLMLTGGVLTWQGYVAYQDFAQYQSKAAKQAVQGSSDQVAQLLLDLRDKVDMLAYAYRDSINAVISNPENAEQNALLGERVQYFFPDHFAYTLADASGTNIYHDDFGEYVGDLCRRDLVEFSQAGFRQRSYIHPGPQEYHVDIMVRLEAGNEARDSIFFVSFYPQAFAALLANSEVAGHKLYLVREDQPDLIEITAEGGRNVLARDIHLSQSEITRIAHSQPVPESRWILVDIPSEQLFVAERNRLLVTGAVTGLVILVVTGIALSLLTRSGKALKRSETRYQHLIDSVRAVVWRATIDPLNIVFMSRRVESMLGYKASAFVQAPDLFFSLIHEDDLVNLNQVIEDAVQSNKCGDIQYRIREKNDGWIWVRNIFVVHTDSSGVTEVEGLMLDVTEQQRLQDKLVERSDELTAAIKELESFSYSVSHDLRSPLRAIDGFAFALEDEFTDDLNSVGRGYIARIRAASQRLGLLIDDLLELSRVSRKSLTLEKVDISALAREMQAQIALEFPDRDVEMLIEPDITVQGDVSLLRIVMQNLLENAWKFTGKTPHAKITVGAREYEGKRCCYVSDNGVGFDMEYASKLFGAFQRLHSMNEYPGTGIGLATVQRIITRHGGRVFAEAKEGTGASFYFCLSE